MARYHNFRPDFPVHPLSHVTIITSSSSSSHTLTHSHTFTDNESKTHRLSRPATLISTDLLNPSLQFRQIQRFTAQFDACVGQDGADFGQFVGIAGNKKEAGGPMRRGCGGGHGSCLLGEAGGGEKGEVK